MGCPEDREGPSSPGATVEDPRAAFGSLLGVGGGSSFAHVERVSGIARAVLFGSGAWIVVIPLFDREGPTASPQIGHRDTFPTCQAEDQKTSPHEQDAGVIFFLTLSSGGTLSFVPHAGQAASFPASRSRTQKSPLQEQLIEIMEDSQAGYSGVAGPRPRPVRFIILSQRRPEKHRMAETESTEKAGAGPEYPRAIASAAAGTAASTPRCLDEPAARC